MLDIWATPVPEDYVFASLKDLIQDFSIGLGYMLLSWKVVMVVHSKYQYDSPDQEKQWYKCMLYVPKGVYLTYMAWYAHQHIWKFKFLYTTYGGDFVEGGIANFPPLDAPYMWQPDPWIVEHRTEIAHLYALYLAYDIFNVIELSLSYYCTYGSNSMALHHLLTTYLIVGSYMMDFHRAVLVVIIMSSQDAIGNFTKLAYESKYFETCSWRRLGMGFFIVLLVVNFVTWFWYRVFLLGEICWKIIYYDMPNLRPLYYLDFRVLMLIGLCLLWVMNTVWCVWMIQKVYLKYIKPRKDKSN